MNAHLDAGQIIRSSANECMRAVASLINSQGGLMRIQEEFRIRNGAGHEMILQNIQHGISYLDFGNTHLPRDFEGYRVKHTDMVAEPVGEDAYRIGESVYRRC